MSDTTKLRVTADRKAAYTIWHTFGNSERGRTDFDERNRELANLIAVAMQPEREAAETVVEQLEISSRDYHRSQKHADVWEHCDNYACRVDREDIAAYREAVARDEAT